MDSSDLFMFTQGTTQYCFLTKSIYEHLFGTDAPTTNPPIRQNNPLNNQPIPASVIEQIRKKYVNNLPTLSNQNELMLEYEEGQKIKVTPTDIENYEQGVNDIVEMAKNEWNTTISTESAGRMYIQDLELSLDDQDELNIYKAIYKYKTNQYV